MLGDRQAQTPPTQDWPVGQAAPQAPQLAASVARSAQPAPHTVCVGLAQRQVPEEQVWPATQRVPQTPQLAASDWRLTHAPPQTEVPVGQAQAPPEQYPPVGHAL